MNKYLMWGIVIVVTIVFFQIIKMFSNSKKGYTTLNASAFEKQSAGQVIIDVRTNGEYSRGYIKNAKSFALNALPKKVSRLNKQKPVYVYCQRGSRSVQACNYLVKMGFTEVYNLRGGISAWRGQIVR